MGIQFPERTRSTLIRRGVLAGVTLLTLAAAAAQESPSLKLESSVLNVAGSPSEGATLTSESYHITLSSLGETAASNLLGSASFHMSAGFVSTQHSFAPAIEVGEVNTAVCGSNAHYAWGRLENGGDNPNIFYLRCAVGGACSATQKLVGAPTVEAKPTVACDGSTVLVAWEDYRDGNADIAMRRSTDGGTSFGSIQFLVRGPADETSPAIAMDNGMVLLVFEDQRNGNKDLASRRSADGGASWGTFTFLVRSPFDDSDPILGLDGDLAFLGWIDRRWGNQDIAYRRSTTGGTSWSNLTFLVRAASKESDPTLAMDGNTVMVAWSDSRFGVQDLAYRRSTNSASSFAGLTFLVRAPSADSEPVMRLSESDALLVWVDRRSGNQNISYRRSGDLGVSWGSTKRLVAAPTDEFGPACDLSFGRAACALLDTRTGMPAPMARESTDGCLTWGALKQLD